MAGAIDEYCIVSCCIVGVFDLPLLGKRNVDYGYSCVGAGTRRIICLIFSLLRQSISDECKAILWSRCDLENLGLLLPA